MAENKWVMGVITPTWNPNDLYFWRSTPQNTAFSNQNKGHLGSSYKWSHFTLLITGRDPTCCRYTTLWKANPIFQKAWILEGDFTISIAHLFSNTSWPWFFAVYREWNIYSVWGVFQYLFNWSQEKHLKMAQAMVQSGHEHDMLGCSIRWFTIEKCYFSAVFLLRETVSSEWYMHAPKTNMASWKITILNRRYILIHDGFSSQSWYIIFWGVEFK